MRIVFIGTPDFAVPSLEKLVDMDSDICLVVTRPDSRRGRGRKLRRSAVKKFACRKGLQVYQPLKFSSNLTKELFERLEPDIGVIVAFGEILSPWLIESFPSGLYNVHASLLPKYRGAAPINHALLNGDSQTGVTVQRVVPRVDAGPVVKQKSTEILADETAEDLHDRLAVFGAECLAEVIKAVLAGKELPERYQDESEVTYAPKLKKEDGRIDWNKSAESIKNHVRGLTPWPGAYCHFLGQKRKEKVTVQQVSCCEERTEKKSPAGEVVEITQNEEMVVQTGNGKRLCIQSLKPAGSKKMSSADFIHGRHVEPGDQFE